jgi:carbon-monoxide dehydrogenase large subunit
MEDNMNVSVGLERRTEDYGLITGLTHYVDDLRPAEGRPAALHMVVARSPYGQAIIEHIDLDAARAVPGVVAAFTGTELVADMPVYESITLPGLKRPERRPLAVGRTHYMGDPVAVVLAENVYAATDARDLIAVDYTPLPAVTDMEAALAPDAPLLYEELGSNIAFRVQSGHGDIEQVFAQADHTTSLRLVNQRLAPSSMEPRACMFDYDVASGKLSAWVSSQSVYRALNTLADFLNIDREHIHVQNAAVGGGFGSKTVFVGEEIIAAALAVKLGRPVKWIETRSENLQAQTHGRGQINYVEAAFKNDGTLLGLKIRSLGDMGAFLVWSTPMPSSRTPVMVCGPYQVQAVEYEVTGVYTNKVPTAAYRGAGRPEATYITERAIEQIARELKLDPVEVRKRNLIPADALPYTTITGIYYDSGNFQEGLDKALKLADYQGWREKQRQRRATHDPKLLGIGVSTFTELSGDSGQAGPLREAATVRIRRDGMLEVESAVAHNGQGHFTAFAQIVSEVFHVPGTQVEVHLNDSALPSFSIGTFGSRVTQVAGSAILLAAEAVREKALQVAAQVLEAAPTDLMVEDGKVMVRGAETRSVALGKLAELVEEQPDLIEHEQPNPANGTPVNGLSAWRDFAPPNATYPSGTHIAVVEVDSDTGETGILAYVAVDDCGRVLNHYLVEMQIHGALAQGIGQALFEEVQYDQDGQLLTSTFMDYAMPVASELPRFTTDLVETPSPSNPLGAKGVGEAGTIGAPPTIVNAVLDALAPFGITTIDMPLKPEKIWALLHQDDTMIPTSPD